MLEYVEPDKVYSHERGIHSPSSYGAHSTESMEAWIERVPRALSALGLPDELRAIAIGPG